MAEKEALNAIKGGLKSTKGFRGVLATAIIFDVLSAIPWVGMIFSGLGYGSIWLWLKIDGANPDLFSGDVKKAASFASEFIAGIFGLGIVPGITVWAYFVIVEYKQEQEEGQKATEKAVLKAKNKFENQQRNTSNRRIKTSAYQ